MKRIVRLKDVAMHAGVSEAAASYALSGKKGVSPQTAERVLKAAKNLGYRMNPLVRSLMEEVRRSRSIHYQGTLAFLHFEKDNQTLAEDQLFIGSAFSGVVQRADEYGFKVDPIPINALSDNPSRLRQILRARSVEGVFVGPLRTLRQHVKIEWGNRAAVAIGYTFMPLSITRVAPENFGGITEAMEKAFQCGFRKPALIFHRDDLDARSSYGFSAGLSTFCRLHKLRTPPLYAEPIGDGKKLRDWLVRTRPKIVFATEGGSVMEKVLQENGIPVCWIGDVMSDGKLGLEQRPKLLGAVAVDELCSMVSRNQRGIPEVPRRITVPLRLCGFEGLKRIRDTT